MNEDIIETIWHTNAPLDWETTAWLDLWERDIRQFARLITADQQWIASRRG